MTKPTRKNSPPVKVYCLPDERAALDTAATSAGLSLSSYLLKVGLGYSLRSVVDCRQVVELAKINADQSRLGNLLKLWLSSDERFASFDEDRMRTTIEAVLHRIEHTQKVLLAAANRI